MKSKKNERVQHPPITNVFEGRNTKENQTLMELKPKDLENASDLYAWSLYWDIVPLHVKKLHMLVKDLDDKLDEKEAVVSKCNLIDRVIEYRERRQALLFCVYATRRCSRTRMLRQRRVDQTKQHCMNKTGNETKLLTR